MLGGVHSPPMHHKDSASLLTLGKAMLRALTEQDIPSLIAIEMATQFSPWTKEIFEKCLLLGSQAWVIEKDQQAVGFVLLFSKVNEGHILNIAVHPDYQHQGYGRLLMSKVIEVAHKESLNIIYLEVRYSNENAISLYEKMGFKRVGIRKNYYQTPHSREDALIFTKLIVEER